MIKKGSDFLCKRNPLRERDARWVYSYTYVTLSSFYDKEHERRAVPFIDYVNDLFMRAQKGHLSLRLILRQSVTSLSAA